MFLFLSHCTEHFPVAVAPLTSIVATRCRLYYKFSEQPVGLEIITSSRTLSLPKYIGEKIIRQMKEYLHREITIQLCRIGSDFEQTLTKRKFVFRWEMLQRIEETIKGIGAAIKKGMSRRFKNEKEATERKNEVSDILTRLDTVKDRLMKLREALGFIRKC
ncbi:MAG: hypothetical protein ABR903_07335 [Thermodesulfovibrionales bacterium]